MELHAFLQQFGSLGDEFLFHFSRPFLLEEGRLELDEEADASEDRQAFYLGGDEDGPLLVGRRAEADVRVHDSNVSSRHARIFPPEEGSGPGWRIVDLGSTNGTFVNGEEVPPHKPHPLQDEAVVSLGPAATFLFLQPQTFLQLVRRLRNDEEQASAQPVSLASQTVQAPAAALDDVSGGGPPKGHAVSEQDPLFIYCDPFDPLPLHMGQLLTVGRSAAKADLVLPHTSVSRRHAEIERRPEGVFVRDLLSANGSQIEDRPLKRQWTRLEPYEVLRVADFRITVQGPPSAGADETSVTQAKRPGAIQGKLETITVEDLLVRIEENHKTGVFELTSDEVSGKVTFHGGHLYQARTSDGLVGADAVRRLLKVKQAQFSFDPGGEVGEREVEESFSRIVLEEFLDSN